MLFGLTKILKINYAEEEDWIFNTQKFSQQFRSLSLHQQLCLSS